MHVYKSNQRTKLLLIQSVNTNFINTNYQKKRVVENLKTLYSLLSYFAYTKKKTKKKKNTLTYCICYTLAIPESEMSILQKYNKLPKIEVGKCVCARVCMYR
jgi:hypothetical protein